MQDYSEFPPIWYFLRVLKGSPKSALLYIQIWEKRNEHFKVLAEKNNIRKDYLISPTLFRNLLSPLEFLNLVEVKECDDRFLIEILGPRVNA
jgi:hypothetical protein